MEFSFRVFLETQMARFCHLTQASLEKSHKVVNARVIVHTVLLTFFAVCISQYPPE